MQSAWHGTILGAMTATIDRLDVGALPLVPKPYSAPLNNLSLAAQGLSLTGSMIGSVAEAREALDFCAEHKIVPWVEVIKIQDVNDALERLKKTDVRFRFVIDLSSLEAS